jgi:antitoxin MazE
MVVTFAKWGNSVALRIPHTFALEIDAKPGKTADLTVQNGKLVLVPVEPPEYDLAELVARITDENRHGEIGTTSAVGNEFA